MYRNLPGEEGQSDPGRRKSMEYGSEVRKGLGQESQLCPWWSVSPFSGPQIPLLSVPVRFQ